MLLDEPTVGVAPSLVKLMAEQTSGPASARARHSCW
jgi:ABC-type branched-subunit amino acid transport system ATPase component